MNALLVALSIMSIAPVEVAPAFVDKHKTEFPSILTATMLEHLGKKYLCGTAHRQGESIVIRYVMSLEADWQIWEPDFEETAWTGWNETYHEICGDSE